MSLWTRFRYTKYSQRKLNSTTAVVSNESAFYLQVKLSPRQQELQWNSALEYNNEAHQQWTTAMKYTNEP